MFQGLVNIECRERETRCTYRAQIRSDDLVGGCLLFGRAEWSKHACLYLFFVPSLFHTSPFAQTRGEGSNLNTANTTRERTAVDKPHEVLMLGLRTQHLFTYIRSMRPTPWPHASPSWSYVLPNFLAVAAELGCWLRQNHHRRRVRNQEGPSGTVAHGARRLFSSRTPASPFSDKRWTYPGVCVDCWCVFMHGNLQADRVELALKADAHNILCRTFNGT